MINCHCRHRVASTGRHVTPPWPHRMARLQSWWGQIQCR